MRWHALAPLLVATGCNWLYGLDKTIAVDGSISELPPASRTKLVWAIATTDGMPVSGTDPVLVYKPIGSETARPQPPMIQVGTDTMLDDAAYDMQDGSFEIPYELRESPHRIVYRVPGESVPHEVQWAVTGAFLVVPRTTRLDAPPVPANSGYTITPTGLGATTTLVAPAVYTSGAFTFSNNSLDIEQSGSSITFAFAQHAKPMAGPLGAPQAGKGDWVMLGEFQSRGPTSPQQSSLRAYAVAKVDLQANMMSKPAPEPVWTKPVVERTLSNLKCPSDPDCTPMIAGSSAATRLHAAIPAGGVDSEFLMYGVSPSTELPGFLPGVAPSYVDRPLIMQFLESTKLDTYMVVSDPSADPNAGLGLERVLAARVSLTRTVNGVPLTSSLQVITNKFETSLDLPAPLVTNIRLGTISLSDAVDAIPVPTSSDVQSLRFTPEPAFTADDYVVTLYELAGTSLVPVRIYHVLQAEVKISGSELMTGHQYVFGITARSGFPGADRGDFGKALYPFGAATTFARTFVVQ
jgi:hypothetical protein